MTLYLSRIIPSLVIALSFASSYPAGAADVSTPTPSSTLHPTSTPVVAPNVASLWRASLKAMKAVRALHSEGVASQKGGSDPALTVPFRSDCVAEAGGQSDQSAQPLLSYRLYYQFTEPAYGSNAVEEIRIKSQDLWLRLASTAGTWVQPGDFGIPRVIALPPFEEEICPQGLNSEVDLRTLRVRNRGADSIDGVSVWHLTYQTKMGGIRESVEVYVDRTSLRWERRTRHIDSPDGSDLIETRYSQFNEAFSIGPPKAEPSLTAPSPTPVPTAGPFPSATPPPNQPSGATLLKQAMAHFLAAGTVRVGLDNMYATPAHGSGTFHGQYDLDYRHLPGSLQGSGDTTWTVPDLGAYRSHTEFTQGGRRGAQRDNRAAWQCFDKAPPIDRSVVTSFAFDGTAEDAQNLGPDFVDGQAVWHVHGQVPQPSGWGPVFKPLPTIPEDFYIAQADGRLVREEERFVAMVRTGARLASVLPGPARVTITAISDFSRYGEPMHIRLPKACHR